MLGDAGDVAEEDKHQGMSAPRDPVGVAESTYETEFDYHSPGYIEMIGRSLLNKGNNVRLKRAIEKAQQGEPVVMAYIGGSVTHGAGAKPIHLRSYAYRSYERFKAMFAPSDGSSIHFVKSGVGGTPSELGVVRYERDVLRDGTIQPDIVIIEFAVNDADDETRGNCYESLVLKAISADNKPAVILLFSVFENDWNLQDRLAPVGWHYDLPMVSMKDALVEQFRKTKDEGNIVSKEQYFHDIYHPTNLGHRIMADSLGHLFGAVNRSELDQEDHDLSRSPLIGDDFVNVTLLDRKNAELLARIDTGCFRQTDTDLQMAELDDHNYTTPLFPNNWMYARGEMEEAKSFRLHLRCRRLILIFKDSGSEEFGTAHIKVNGILTKQADPHEVNWTCCHAMLLINEKHVREHMVEIEMAEAHKDKRFTILGFGYVG
ncbi:SGNH/GDSL hydrolase family protein [Paenibacillus taichungensis]|uniref:SGNH/GDSL hydrolase family protein n=1 Tax=Paenibacillus taichungensis TaxID=484184 RepID=A0ABX2MD07_9BACL|nr:SGNH/GDSL hydrolase family protein [Paenibacillus taichungensis]NUU52717.1 SGNH/GDSL hydrolase family protein [Paenibacillus taichungensis]